MTKTLIRLWGCAGCSAVCCSQTTGDKFSHVAAHIRSLFTDAKKWREQKVHALMAMRMRQCMYILIGQDEQNL